MAIIPEATYCTDAYQAAEGADAILIVTEWDEFRQIDWTRLLSTVEQTLVIDERNIFKPDEVRRNGFRYSASAGSMPFRGNLLPATRSILRRCKQETRSRRFQPDPQRITSSAYPSSSRPARYSLLSVALFAPSVGEPTVGSDFDVPQHNR